MLVQRGIAVSPGVVIGSALVLGTEDFRIPRRFVSVDAVDTEVARFHNALTAVCDEIAENQEQASQRLGEQAGAIFAAHLEMARSPQLVSEIEGLIRDKSFSPEFACTQVLTRFAKEIQNLGNYYLAERALDIFDLEKRILRQLLGESREELAHLTAPVVVLANNLTPSETSNLNPEFVLGFATEAGGPTSHTAILAGALEIPAVVGIGPFLSEVSGGETIVLDGHHGEVIIDPDDATLAKYRETEKKFKRVVAHWESLGPLASDTQDGTHIQLMGNIEFPEEVEHCTERGAEGIGLYHTEFLYLRNDTEPAEEDHYNAYVRVALAFPEHPVIIRTLDLGADKIPGPFQHLLSKELNPELGLRSVRLSLQHLPLFKTQLRAILRAAVDSDVRIMFPLISSLLELRQAKMIVREVIEDLEENKIPFNRNVPVGMMVEVPSAALLADEFAREVDFFSIGTNDLIQYTLAADRSDPAVATLYSSGDPSVLRLIRTVVEAGRRHDIPVSVCGQMSSDPKFIPLLIGIGLRQLSVTPHAIPEVKETIRHLTVEQAEAITAHAESLDVSRDVEAYLREQLKVIYPESML